MRGEPTCPAQGHWEMRRLQRMLQRKLLERLPRLDLVRFPVSSAASREQPGAHLRLTRAAFPNEGRESLNFWRTIRQEPPPTSDKRPDLFQTAHKRLWSPTKALSNASESACLPHAGGAKFFLLVGLCLLLVAD